MWLFRISRLLVAFMAPKYNVVWAREMVRSAWCSFGGFKFSSQHPCKASYNYLYSSSRGSDELFGLCRHPHVHVCTHNTCRDAQLYTHFKKKYNIERVTMILKESGDGQPVLIMLTHIYCRACGENPLSLSTQITIAMVERNQYLAQASWQPHSVSVIIVTAGLLYANVCRPRIFLPACLQSDFCSPLPLKLALQGWPIPSMFLWTQRTLLYFPTTPLSGDDALVGLPWHIRLFLNRDFTFYLSGCCYFLVFSFFYSCFCLSDHSDFCPKNSRLLSMYFTWGFTRVHGSDIKMHEGSPVILLKLHTVLCATSP